MNGSHTFPSDYFPIGSPLIQVFQRKSSHLRPIQGEPGGECMGGGGGVVGESMSIGVQEFGFCAALSIGGQGFVALGFSS